MSLDFIFCRNKVYSGAIGNGGMCLGGVVLYILFALAPTDAEKQAMRHSAEHHNHTYQDETAVVALTKADVLQSSYRFSVIFCLV